jgi:predicted phage terminase large subunit-like protein
MYSLYASQNKLTSFWQEFMLVIAPKENLLYDTSKIRRYSYKDLGKKRSTLTYYITVDLAISQKDTADYTVITIMGINENNDWMLVDGFFGRIKPDETMEKIFEYVVMYRPYEVIIEKVAFQTAMKTFLEREMLLRNIYFSINMVQRPSHKNSKLSVLKGFQPIVNMGKFWVPEDYMDSFVNELINEMSLITNDKILAKHDDLIDSIAQLTLVNILTQTPVTVGGSEYITPVKNSYLF